MLGFKRNASLQTLDSDIENASQAATIQFLTRQHKYLQRRMHSNFEKSRQTSEQYQRLFNFKQSDFEDISEPIPAKSALTPS